jgi:hypothetical protein
MAILSNRLYIVTRTRLCSLLVESSLLESMASAIVYLRIALAALRVLRVLGELVTMLKVKDL